MVENSPRIPFSLDDSLKRVEGTMPKATQMKMEVVASSTLPNVPKQPETADGRLEERMKTFRQRLLLHHAILSSDHKISSQQYASNWKNETGNNVFHLLRA